MYDSRCMRGTERIGHLAAIPQHLRNAKSSAGNKIQQRHARNEFHHQIVCIGLSDDVVDGNDVRVI